jgi:hypothetical protein
MTKTCTNRVLVLGTVFYLVYCINTISSSKLVSSQKVEEERQINDLQIRFNELKETMPNFFYNYSILCGGNAFESRVSLSLIDETIPNQFKNFILETYQNPEVRQNKCPTWTNAIEASEKKGAMSKLVIEENTKVGQRVFTLLATDPESQPILYFIRNIESESENNTPIIFDIRHVKVGNNWEGQVILDTKLDYETKKSYQYLTYAFDGVNLIERYTSIEIVDIDDEIPRIETTQNSVYNQTSKQFEFFLNENLSIGAIINPGQNRIRFSDNDTQITQLKVNLINQKSDALPFSVNNDGEIKLTGNLDYETIKEYLFKIQVEVSYFF